MPRRVAVVAELDAGQYIAEARAMKAETAAADREMGQLDRSIDKVDRDMVQLAATTTVAAKQVDNLGDQARGSAAALTALDARIKATRLSVHNLGDEWARTGDEADRVAFTAEKRALAALERLRNTLVPDGGGSTIYRSANALGPNVASAGAGEVGSLRQLTGPVMVGAVGGLITAFGLALPTLGAMIAGVVAGAIGTGGVAGGLLMAAKDPFVRAAASKFGDSIAEEFFSGGKAFAPQAIKSMHILEDAFKGLHLPDVFAKVAPDVEIITHGIVALVEQAMPGLEKAFGRMEPFADAAAEGFSDIGTALGSFAEATTSSEGSVMGLRAAFNLIAATITATGAVVHDLSDAFLKMEHGFRRLVEFGIKNPLTPPPVKDALRGILRELDDLETGTRNMPHVMGDASFAIESFGESVDRTTELTKVFNDALDASYTAFLDFTGAEIGAEEAIDKLQEAIAENGVTLDVHTEKGREQVGMLKRLAESAAEAAKQKLIETGSVEEANAVYDSYRQQLYDTFINAGMTAAKAQELTDKWLALQTLQDIEKFVQINVTAKVQAYYSDTTSNPFLKGFAEGGETPAYEPFVVGEHGPELMYSSRRAFVANQSQAWNGTVGASLDYARLGMELANALQSAPIENTTNIEIGGEVVRVVRSEQSASNRDLRRRVLAGVGG